MGCEHLAIRWGTYNVFPCPWFPFLPCLAVGASCAAPASPSTHPICSLLCVWEEPSETLRDSRFSIDFSLQINHFSVLLVIPCCLIIPPCRVCLLLLELPGNGTKNPRETLLRSQACSHGDICGGKCSPYQQIAVMRIHKQTQINRLAPPSKPEIHPHGQMLQQVYVETRGHSKMHI